MGTDPGTQGTAWAVVVPVKRLDVAKSRLGVLGDGTRRALALAFAEDVVLAATAARQVRAVVAVTDDPDAARALTALGAHVVADAPRAGIDAALRHGAAAAGDVVPGTAVAALAGDLPALTASALDDVLRRVRGRAVVADAAGDGTTLLAAADGRLAPSYGPGSLHRHLAWGAVLLEAPAQLRRDVDTAGDLHDAVRLGVGRQTARVLARLTAGACSPGGGTMRG